MQKAVSKRWCDVVWVFLFMVVFGASADTFNFTNSGSITINTDPSPPTIATPYPSTIHVSGLDGQVITDLNVTLNGFSHPFPSDVSVLLVGPQGQMALLMSDVGGSVEDFPVTNITLVLDDNSPYPLPVNDSLFSGTFHPTAGQTPLFFDFPSPAPAGNSNAVPMLSIFDGTDPDGDWNLFVVDDFEEVTNGYFSGGWSMSVSVGVPLQITNSATNVLLSWPVVSGHTFTLQFTPGLTSPAWTNLPVTPAEISGRFVVTNKKSGPIGIYRLIVQ